MTTLLHLRREAPPKKILIQSSNRNSLDNAPKPATAIYRTLETPWTPTCETLADSVPAVRANSQLKPPPFLLISSVNTKH